MADQASVEDQPGYMGAIQRELEELVGFPSLSRVSRRVRRNTANRHVSNSVRDETKLQ